MGMNNNICPQYCGSGPQYSKVESLWDVRGVIGSGFWVRVQGHRVRVQGHRVRVQGHIQQVSVTTARH